jgi:hypothetical protein
MNGALVPGTLSPGNIVGQPNSTLESPGPTGNAYSLSVLTLRPTKQSIMNPRSFYIANRVFDTRKSSSSEVEGTCLLEEEIINPESITRRSSPQLDGSLKDEMNSIMN